MSHAGWTLHVPRAYRQLFPVCDRVDVPADKAKTSVLRDDQWQCVMECLAQPVGGAVSCPHTIGAYPFAVVAVQVARARYQSHFRQLAGDLNAESEDLKRVGDSGQSRRRA
jgi:hypothetical protein